MELTAITTEITLIGVAKILHDKIFTHYRMLYKVISDQGSTFISKFMKDFYGLLGIEANSSTAYHPQTDGQMECKNQDIEEYLHLYVNYRQDDWAEWLSLAQFTHNDKETSATGTSPFFALYGQHPWKGTTARTVFTNDSAKEHTDLLREIHNESQTTLTHTQEQMKRQAPL